MFQINKYTNKLFNQMFLINRRKFFMMLKVLMIKKLRIKQILMKEKKNLNKKKDLIIKIRTLLYVITRKKI